MEKSKSNASGIMLLWDKKKKKSGIRGLILHCTQISISDRSRVQMRMAEF